MMTGVLVSGIGHSLCIPGYSASPTLLVRRDEQGGVAGLMGTTTALTGICGPLLATTLYQVAPIAPYLFGVVELGLLLGFVLWHRPPARPDRHHEREVHRGYLACVTSRRVRRTSRTG